MERRRDVLGRLTVHLDDSRAQRLMSPHHFVETPLGGGYIQSTTQTKSDVKVVERIVRFEPIEKPKPLLRERERKMLSAGAGGDGRRRRRFPRTECALDGLRDSRDGRRLEHAAQRHLHLESFSQSRDDLRGEKRVTAQLEEVVVRTDALYAEQLLPDVGDRLLCRSRRLDVCTRHCGSFV